MGGGIQRGSVVSRGGSRPGAGRPPTTNPRSVAVMVRLTAAEATVLDAERGALSRSAWLLLLSGLKSPGRVL